MGTIVASENVFPLLRMAEVAAPSTPPAGEAHLYVKSDGLLDWKDDAGTEYAITTGGASAIPETLIDAKGDLIAGDAADSVARLAVGTDGHVLTADSGEATGLIWAAPAAAGDLDDLGDVDAASPSDGDVLTFDSGSGDWINAAPAGGGGGVPGIVQQKSATGSPAASLVWDSAPANGAELLIWGANNGSGPTAMSSTNTTWTKIVTDSVGGVGDLWVFRGVVSGGAGGTTVTFTGGSGGSSAFGVELQAGASYSSVVESTDNSQTGTNHRTTTGLAVTASAFVAGIINSGGAAPGGRAHLSGVVNQWWDDTNTINSLCGGWGAAGGQAKMTYPTAAAWYKLAVMTYTGV